MLCLFEPYFWVTLKPSSVGKFLIGVQLINAEVMIELGNHNFSASNEVADG